MKKSMKTLKVKRIALKDNYTIGKVYIDGEYVCDCIEDKVRELKTNRDKVYGETAIPYGKYSGEVFYSNKFGYNVIRLFGVPFFEGIYIHKGNTQKDSLGCIIVGFNTKVGWVSRPSVALARIVDAIKADGGKCLVVVE